MTKERDEFKSQVKEMQTQIGYLLKKLIQKDQSEGKETPELKQRLNSFQTKSSERGKFH